MERSDGRRHGGDPHACFVFSSIIFLPLVHFYFRSSTPCVSGTTASNTPPPLKNISYYSDVVYIVFLFQIYIDFNLVCILVGFLFTLD